MSLTYGLRIRDLLHGFVYLTDLERGVVDHPLFQRLRYIRQNDVASFVYPSLNTTRFEHSLGTCAVAGRMAENITRGYHWPVFQEALNTDAETFIQVCRLYGLLHDVGHLPLSHLFETAFEDHAARQGQGSESLARAWTGVVGFRKLHEAVGARIAPLVMDQAHIPTAVAGHVRRLVTEKHLAHDDPLRVVKLLVDSEVDADRADSTARDGRLAGGEYGTYDMERLAGAVFVLPTETGWGLAYSDKAVGTLESLLFDRYRTHTWIHHHHRIVAVRTAAREVIAALIDKGEIGPADFTFDRPEQLALLDDPWLWGVVRRAQPDGLMPEWRLLVLRDKSRARLVWKWRREWAATQQNVKQRAGVRDLRADEFTRGYEAYASARLNATLRLFFISFRPTDTDVVPLTDERGHASHGDLMSHSNLVASLADLWSKEPQYYATAFGGPDSPRKALTESWTEVTVDWLRMSASNRDRWSHASTRPANAEDPGTPI